MMRPNWKQMLLGVATSGVLAGCMPPADAGQTEQAVSTNQVWSATCSGAAGAAGAAASAGILGAFCKVTDALIGLISPGDPVSIRDLYNEVVSIDNQLKTVEAQVLDLVYEGRREEALSLQRAIDGARASVIAALTYAADHPGDTTAELGALDGAHALESVSYYSLPGRTAGAPDRFDPRAALPSFVAAVDSWLALHQADGTAWTASSQADVATFAARLEWVASKMEQSIHCSEQWQTFDTTVCPPPKKHGPHPTPIGSDPPPDPVCQVVTRCSHVVQCTDDMALDYGNSGATTNGECVQDTDDNANKAYAQRVADYAPAKYRAIAGKWRAAAGL